MSEKELVFGETADGWSDEAWAQELRRMANCCQPLHPKRAKELRVWATEIEKRIPTRTPPTMPDRLTRQAEGGGA